MTESTTHGFSFLKLLKVPLDFEKLRRYPVSYILFLSLGVIGFLYFQTSSAKNEVIKEYQAQQGQDEKDKVELKTEVLFLDSLLRDCMKQKGRSETIDSLRKRR